MNENKYYIPDYNDIYIGQELYTVEGYKIELGTTDDLTWFLLNNNCCISGEGDTTYGISLENYRLKYLDSEDIESLGFKYNTNSNTFVKEKYDPLDHPDDKTYIHISYYPTLHEVCVHNGRNYDSEIVWFDGKIKNKSELKKLLTQLGIK